MLRIGLIGCGRIGRVHALGVERNRKSRLAAVFDPVGENAAAVAAQFGSAIAASAEEVFASSDIDAVIIASPTGNHKEHFLTAARAGKAVYGEKPIDNNLRNANEAVIELRRCKVPIMIGFNRRYDRDHAALRAEVRKGGIGRVQAMQLASRGPNSVPSLAYLRGSGGFYRDKCVHFIDLVRWIAGEDPVAVAAMGSVIADASVGEANDVDTAGIMMRMSSGAIAHIDNARRAVYGYDDRIEVFGTEGLIESSRKRRGNVMQIRDDAVMLEGLPKDSFARYSESYAAAFDAFIEMLDGGPDDVPTIEDGLMAQVIAEAATISGAESRIVPLKEILDTL